MSEDPKIGEDIIEESPSIKKIRETRIEEDSYIFALDKVEANLKNLSGNDILQLRELLSGEDFTDEERDAVEQTLNGLNALRVMSDKLGALKRYTRHLEDLARAQTVLDRISDGSCNDSLRYGIKYFVDAVYAIASPDEQKEAGKVMGLMDAEELARRREELSKLNIS